MAVSEIKLHANQCNARRSSGPASAEGKQTASLNALRHGTFSTRLLLEDENPAELEALIADLVETLKPIGSVELGLVEKIATSIWRQRRLVQAETAALAIARRPDQIAEAVSRHLDLDFSSKLKADDLQPFDQDQFSWCTAVVAQYQKLSDLSVESIKAKAPLLYEQLISDAEDDEGDVTKFLSGYENGLRSYLGELIHWCHRQISTAKQRPHTLKLAEQFRSKRLILPAGTLELFSRYQTMLDNQLYKALRAFREAQEWRLKTLDAANDGAMEAAETAA